MTAYPNTLGNFLREQRKEARLTIQALSEKIGLSRGVISNIELGENAAPNIHVLAKFGEVFGVSAVELMYMIDEHTVISLAYLHFYEEHEYVPR